MQDTPIWRKLLDVEEYGHKEQSLSNELRWLSHPGHGALSWYFGNAFILLEKRDLSSRVRLPFILYHKWISSFELAAL